MGISRLVILVSTNVMVAHAFGDFNLCKDCFNSKDNHSDNGGGEDSGPNGGDTTGNGNGGSDSGGN